MSTIGARVVCTCGLDLRSDCPVAVGHAHIANPSAPPEDLVEFVRREDTCRVH